MTNQIKRQLDELKQKEKEAQQNDEQALKALQSLPKAPEPEPGNSHSQKEEEEDQKSLRAMYELVESKLKAEYPKALLDAFDEKYGKNNRQEGLLAFASDEDAIKFFESQAKLGMTFLCKKCGADLYVYSNGDGKLFSGTKEQLEQHLKAPTFDNVSHDENEELTGPGLGVQGR